MDKTAAIAYFTSNGRKRAEKIEEILKDLGLQVSLKNKDEKLKDWSKRAFLECQYIFFVGATAIAVRTIGPLLKSKTEDPAVIVVDDMGTFVIPLVSGHIGGANAMAKILAEKLGSTPVITTATDVNGKIAIDSWAVANNLVIENMNLAKECAMRLLEEKPVALVSDLPVQVETEGITLLGKQNCHLQGTKVSKEKFDFGINISWRKEKYFKKELKLIPKGLVLGIGCRRGTSAKTIENAVVNILNENNIYLEAVTKVATIDLKKDEEGLLDFARDKSMKLEIYTSDELAAAKGNFKESEFVRKVTGVGNVCQRAAVVACQEGEVIVEKSTMDGVTVALAVPKVIKERILNVK